MDTWTDRDERQAAARAEYERIRTTPSPDPSSAYIDVGVIGFVFGEMWRRGVLTARDRRFITLACLGSTDAGFPIETHVWAALNSGDISAEEFDEFVLHFATQLGWPKGSVLQMHGMMATARLAEQRGGGGGRPARGRAVGRPRARRGTPCAGRGRLPRRTGPGSTVALDGVPPRRVPRLPLRGDLDEGRAPDPAGPQDHQYLLLRRRRRRDRDAGPPRGGPGQQGADEGRAGGARRGLRRLRGVGSGPSARRPADRGGPTGLTRPTRET